MGGPNRRERCARAILVRDADPIRPSVALGRSWSAMRTQPGRAQRSGEFGPPPLAGASARPTSLVQRPPGPRRRPARPSPPQAATTASILPSWPRGRRPARPSPPQAATSAGSPPPLSHLSAPPGQAPWGSTRRCRVAYEPAGRSPHGARAHDRRDPSPAGCAVGGALGDPGRGGACPARAAGRGAAGPPCAGGTVGTGKGPGDRGSRCSIGVCRLVPGSPRSPGSGRCACWGDRNRSPGTTRCERCWRVLGTALQRITEQRPRVDGRLPVARLQPG